MLNLGIVAYETEPNEPLTNLLKQEHCRVSFIEKKEQLEQLNGLVITMKTKNHLTKVIDWLMACQRNPKVFVWIFSEVPLESEQQIMMTLGANDVITSMDNLDRLQITIKNVFSRLKNQKMDKAISSSRKILNEKNLTVYINGIEVSLTKKEFTLLGSLYTKKNTTIHYNELMKTLWPNQPKEHTFLLTNTIFHLRKKVERSKEFRIINVRSEGYMIKMENDAS